MFRLLRPIFAVAALLGAATAQSATVTVETRTLPGLSPKAPIVSTTIRITGRFEEGDGDRLRAEIGRLRLPAAPTPGLPLAVAELSSEGGDVYEGLKIGYLFKEFNIATMVRKGDLCLSACAFAFLGGTASHLPPELVPARTIEIGGQVGFHNFYINPSSAKLAGSSDPSANLVRGFDLARGGSSLLLSYSVAMSINAGFVARLLGRPSEEWEYIDIDGEFVELASCPQGIERPQVGPPAVAANLCNHGTGWISPANAGQARRLGRSEAKRLLLQQVQQNVQSLGLKGPLAGQLAAVLAGRDDGLVEAVYADLRQAGVALPEVLGATYEVTGYRAGAYTMSCVASFSLDDPDRFDLAIQGPTGLTRALRAPPPACRRLFLFDRDDVLNPRK